MVNASTLVFSTQPQANVALLRRHKCNLPDLSTIVSISWHLWAFYFLGKSLPLSSSSIIFPTLFRRRQSRRGVTKKEVWGHIGNRQRTSILSLYKSPFQNRGSNFSLRNSRQAWLFAQTNLSQGLSWFSRTFHFGGLEFSILDLSWSGFFFRKKQPPNVVLQRTIFEALHVCTEAWKMETQCVNIFVRLKCCSKHFLISSYLWSWAFTREMNRPPRFKCWMSLHCKLQAVTLAKIVRVWCALFFTLDLLSYCE